jgi:hypothetical protein
MNDDLDQWATQDGPEPPWLRKLLDAGREVPDMTPDQAEEMERAFLAALAKERRKAARDRQIKWGAGLGAAAAVLLVVAGPAVIRALRPAPLDDRVAKGGVVPTATGVSTTGATTEPPRADPASPDAGADAGASRRPGGAPRRRH